MELLDRIIVAYIAPLTITCDTIQEKKNYIGTKYVFLFTQRHLLIQLLFLVQIQFGKFSAEECKTHWSNLQVIYLM
jgi:hypothetical protein